MLEYAPMPHVTYYAQNYAGIIHQGLLNMQVTFDPPRLPSTNMALQDKDN